jgi:hypothetical protein
VGSGEAFSVVVGLEGDRTLGHEQWSGLHEIAERPRRSRGPFHEAHVAIVDHDAAAASCVRFRDRFVALRPAVDPQLAERPVRVAEKEAADDGFFDAVPPTPHIEVLGSGEVQDTRARRSPRVAHGVHRRDLAVRERVAPEQIFDPVARR